MVRFRSGIRITKNWKWDTVIFHSCLLCILHSRSGKTRLEAGTSSRKKLDRRLENGGGHTGWSKAWIILFFARLWKKEKAYQNLQELLAEATLDNLLDNHPPFQIDGNFGGACGILEMIVQDYQDVVYLLPALPQEMPDGNVSGIRTKSGFILNMEWSGCRVKSVEVESVHGTQITIVNETLESRKIRCEKGE